MTVRAPRSGPTARTTALRRRARSLRLRSDQSIPSQQIGEVLGYWQTGELRIARGFPECRGLSTEQLEDIYQETALALYSRSYQSEEHLRNALRTGLKHRALRLHRDERRRRQILFQSAPGLRLMAQANEEEDAPEPAALAHEDRLIVSEFLTELNTVERRVFSLLAENMQYRAIAPVLGMPVNEARNTARSCARKRERFQLLYDTGRLCGYRSRTIQALKAGDATSDELAERAFAHLRSCAHCRAEHKTNATRLRRSFHDQAAALLPIPALLVHTGWLARLHARIRALQYRLGPERLPFGQGGLHERAAVLLASGGAAAKVAAGAATVVVIAAGTIRATHALEQKPAPQQPAPPHMSTVVMPGATASSLRFAATPFLRLIAVRYPVLRASHHPRHSVPGHVVSVARRVKTTHPLVQREPGGFGNPGVAVEPNTPPSRPRSTQPEGQSGGGLFSP